MLTTPPAAGRATQRPLRHTKSLGPRLATMMMRGAVTLGKRSARPWRWEAGGRQTAPRHRLARGHQEVHERPSSLLAGRHFGKQPLREATAGATAHPAISRAPSGPEH